MKTALFIPNLERGGAERQVSLLAREIKKRNIDVDIIVLHAGGAFENALREADINIVCLDKKRSSNPLYILFELIKYLRVNKPDILYSFMPLANVFSLCAKLIFDRPRIIWGVRASDMPLHEYGFRTRLFYVLEKYLHPLADMIIANSEAGRAICLDKGVPSEKVRVVSNGFDIEVFRPDPIQRQNWRKRWNIKQHELVFGLPSRLDPVKDHSTYLSAAALHLEKGFHAHFVIIGGGSEDYEKSLKYKAKQLGLSEHVTWTGQVDNIQQVLNGLDVVCLTSVSEGFPNALGEAMATGLAVVSSDVGDARALISDAGEIFEVGNVDQLAAVMERLQDADKRRDYGRRARLRIIDNYSPASTGMKTIEIFRKVLE
ncbi:glycosyltransferase [Thalassospira alkalitolerans]|uniref:glycosyltransferase n=1 Tax=Thalassospira alkalitolerans TaxID=1293890 RepID=UPI003AA85F17